MNPNGSLIFSFLPYVCKCTNGQWSEITLRTPKKRKKKKEIHTLGRCILQEKNTHSYRERERERTCSKQHIENRKHPQEVEWVNSWKMSARAYAQRKKKSKSDSWMYEYTNQVKKNHKCTLEERSSLAQPLKSFVCVRVMCVAFAFYPFLDRTVFFTRFIVPSLKFGKCLCADVHLAFALPMHFAFISFHLCVFFCFLLFPFYFITVIDLFIFCLSFSLFFSFFSFETASHIRLNTEYGSFVILQFRYTSNINCSNKQQFLQLIIAFMWWLVCIYTHGRARATLKSKRRGPCVTFIFVVNTVNWKQKGHPNEWARERKEIERKRESAKKSAYCVLCSYTWLCWWFCVFFWVHSRTHACEHHILSLLPRFIPFRFRIDLDGWLKICALDCVHVTC